MESFRSTAHNQPLDEHDAGDDLGVSAGFLSAASAAATPVVPAAVGGGGALDGDGGALGDPHADERIYRSIGPLTTGLAPAPASSSFWDHATLGSSNSSGIGGAGVGGKELSGELASLSLNAKSTALGGGSDGAVKTIALNDANSFIRQLSSSSTTSSLDEQHLFPTKQQQQQALLQQQRQRQLLLQQQRQQQQQHVPLSQALPPLSAFSRDAPLRALQHARALPQPPVLESSHVVLSHPPAVVFGKMLAVFASYDIARNRATLRARSSAQENASDDDDDEEDDQDDVLEQNTLCSITHDVSIVKLVASKYKVKAAVVPCRQFAACTFQCQVFAQQNGQPDAQMCVLEFQRRRGCPFTFHSVFQQLVRILDTKAENACTRAPLQCTPAFLSLPVSRSVTQQQQQAAGQQNAALESMQELTRLHAAGDGSGDDTSTTAASLSSVTQSSSPEKEQQCVDLLTKVLGDQSAPFAACTSAQLDSVTSILATTSAVPSFQQRLLTHNHHLLHALARLLNNANVSAASQRNIVQSLQQIAEHSTAHASSLVRALKMAPSQYNQVIALLALFAAPTSGGGVGIGKERDPRLVASAKAALACMQVV